MEYIYIRATDGDSKLSNEAGASLMIVEKTMFSVRIKGKCETEQDIITMWNFGYSLKGIIRQYAKDNKMKVKEADKIVTNVLYKNAM